MPTPALLALADGTLFHGEAVGASGSTAGEVVFNTAMTGYQEILTDASYAQQIVTLTAPHIGNTGCNVPDEGERRVVQVAWLTSEEEKLRKTQRGTATRFFKKIAGGLDRKFGAGRDRNAAHRD